MEMVRPLCTLTQYGLDHSIFQNLKGAGADKIISVQGISVADEVFSRCAEGGFDVQRKGTQTPSAGSFEHRQLQDVFVQMHGNICPQLVWEVMQQLQEQEEKSRALVPSSR